MVKALLEGGYDTTVFDNLAAGHRDAVLGGRFVQGDLADTATLDALFAAGRFDAVMNFAGSIQVGESVQKPGLYYRNNVANTLNLLEAMVRHGVRHLVFSSTAAIFGEPVRIPIDEEHPTHPVNPYGRGKLMVEHMLADFDHAHGLKSACLRYFNAAGADPSGLIGERHEPETHLIPIALEVALGKRGHLSVYGEDYDTPDGTCIRDYIHVSDLCQAHLRALETLRRTDRSLAVNLGNGQGFSVREVVDAVRAVTGHAIPLKIDARRAGDPARLIADSTAARDHLGWRPQYPGLQDIVRHAWTFHLNRAVPHPLAQAA
ncbi:MAG: UDP-glucose 4-epimerase GalE [Betaproteobacteria bacterium]|nr:UDP-glucose 4-epimerase GalE [Betaproteobacteria bacterium]